MNFIDRFFSSFAFGGGKDRYTQTDFPRFANTMNIKGEQWIDTSKEHTFNLFNTTAELKSVITRKADMYANGVFQHIKNGEIVENSKAVYRLENPNPLQNGNEFMRQECMLYSIYGNSMIYGLKGFSSEKIPTALYLLPSDKTSIIKTGKIFQQTKIEDIISRYKVVYDNVEEFFESKDIIHLKTSNPLDPIVGLSPIEALTMVLSNIRAAYGFRNRIITNDAALGILSSATADGMGVSLSPEEQERLNKGHKESYGMQRGKSNILMTESSVSWNPMSYPTKDLMLFEEVTAGHKVIIDYFGLNDNLFSFEKASTFSNLKEGIKLAYQDCIIPFAQDRDLAYSKAFGMDGINEYIHTSYDHLAILQDDKDKTADANKKKAETYAILTANGRADLANELYE